jgi:hypothetical protein
MDRSKYNTDRNSNLRKTMVVDLLEIMLHLWPTCDQSEKDVITQRVEACIDVAESEVIEMLM